MRLQLRVDGQIPRRWHIDLMRRLADRPGIVPSLAFSGDGVIGGGGRSRLDRLLNLEGLLHGLGHGTMATAGAADAAMFVSPRTLRPDLLIDLSAPVPEACDPAAAGVVAERVWSLTFDGQGGEAALAGSLLRGRSPLAAISEAGRQLAAGRLGIEGGGSLLAALQDATARLSTLILAALTGAARSVPALVDEPNGGPRGTMSMAGAVAQAARQRLRATARRGYHALYQAPHWRVGWRRLDGNPDILALRDHPQTGWRTLPDDGSRFYADPFPIEHDGRVTVFVEDFSHSLRRGVISAVEFDGDGPLGTPEPVLTLPYHLSYPFVFAADGERWMIPESCVAGSIDLFRATRFPGGWTKEATLVTDIVASDATLVEHGGRWWMFATVRDGGGAFSDTLHVWSAADFRGPWSAHSGNPVLIDIASARPAGRFVVRDGVLLRPVQDCRRGYGAALGIARVDRLDDTGFEQTVETILTAGPRWPGRRLHTLNTVSSRAGDFEFIDGSAHARRRWLRR